MAGSLVDSSAIGRSDPEDQFLDCSSGSWAPPPPKKSTKKNSAAVQSTISPTDSLTAGPQADCETGAVKSAEEAAADNKSLWMSLLTLAISIPSIVAGWCWPALVMPLLGEAVTASARNAGHIVAFCITIPLMMALTAYIAWQGKKRQHYPTMWQRQGPLILTAIGALLVCLEPSRHFFIDRGVLPVPMFAEYTCDQETFSCLSGVGWAITICATYIGLAMVMVGSLWSADIMSRLKLVRLKYREIMQDRQRRAAATKVINQSAKQGLLEPNGSGPAIPHSESIV